MKIFSTRIVLFVSLLLSSFSYAAPSADEMWQAIQALQAENQRLRSALDQAGINVPTAQRSTTIYTPDPDTAEVTLNFGGFIRGDVGFGDRYGDSEEDDRIGVSRSAFAILPEYKNVKGTFVVGTEITSSNFLGNDGAGTEDGDVDIKDVFITIEDFLADGLDVRIGAQPLLIGLKPEGYPGDHSIQGSVEYGAGGAFAVSYQPGTALTANYSFNSNNVLRVGIFDQKDFINTGVDQEGSSLSDNVFVQWTSNDLFGSGIYANAFFEDRYTTATDDSESIYGFGVGIKQGIFDLSVELVNLDENIMGTGDDETYIIAETMFQLNDVTSIYLDYADADELDITTTRIGLDYQYNKFTRFSLEYADDELANDDIDSFDIRVALEY